MGAKNLDRIPMAEWRRKAETVADMQAQGWDVITKCQACGLAMTVNLDLVGWVAGPRTVLWNRKARCRRIGCSGFVEFQGRPPRRQTYEPLRAPAPSDVPVGGAGTPSPDPNTPRLSMLVETGSDLHVRCTRCDKDYVLTADRAVKAFGRQTTFADMRKALRAECRAGGACEITAGTRLPPDGPMRRPGGV